MARRLGNLLLLSAAAAAVATDGGSGSASTPPRAHQLDAAYTFEQYLAHFGKSYPDPSEYARRSAIFARNMKKILRHNEGRMTAEGEVVRGYVMGVNAFTDSEGHELPLGYNKGLHPAWRDQMKGATSVERRLGKGKGGDADSTTAYQKPPDFEMDEVSSLPASVDWVTAGNVNPVVPHQGGCGSCWTFAATAAVESALSIATGEDPLTLSQQNMLVCAPNPEHCGGDGGCTGSTVELGLNYIAGVAADGQGGMYTLDDVPYSYADADDADCAAVTKGASPAVGIQGWTQLPTNDYQAAMNAVAKVGPVAVSVAAGSWAYYESGVFDEDDVEVNHAVLLAGYGVDDATGEKYWKIRNSWGPDFGEDGYIRIKRTDLDATSCEEDGSPLVGITCALDDEGNPVDVASVTVCGTCGVIFDVAYPVGVHNIE